MKILKFKFKFCPTRPIVYGAHFVSLFSSATPPLKNKIKKRNILLFFFFKENKIYKASAENASKGHALEETFNFIFDFL